MSPEQTSWPNGRKPRQADSQLPSLKRSSCRASLKGFLDGKDVEPQIDKQVMGGIIRIEVYHNADAALAYAQYFTGNSYLALMEGG